MSCSIHRLTAICSLMLASATAHAMPITVDDIPAAADCNADCYINWGSNFYSPDLSAVQIARTDGADVSLSWLVRYNIQPPSAITQSTDYDYDNIYDTSGTPYSGHVWLEAPDSLDENAINAFDLYTEQLEPGQYEFQDITFGMTYTDAQAGQASRYQSTDDGYGDTYSSGDLIVQNPLYSCIECGYSATLGLVGLDYSSGQLSLEPLLENQVLLLSYSDFYDYFDNTRELYVSTVPLPAAAWLMLSGLALLATRVRQQ